MCSDLQALLLLKPELNAASELRLFRCRGGVSFRSTPGAFSNRKYSEMERDSTQTEYLSGEKNRKAGV